VPTRTRIEGIDGFHTLDLLIIYVCQQQLETMHISQASATNQQQTTPMATILEPSEVHPVDLEAGRTEKATGMRVAFEPDQRNKLQDNILLNNTIPGRLTAPKNGNYTFTRGLPVLPKGPAISIHIANRYASDRAAVTDAYPSKQEQGKPAPAVSQSTFSTSISHCISWVSTTWTSSQSREKDPPKKISFTDQLGVCSLYNRAGYQPPRRRSKQMQNRG